MGGFLIYKSLLNTITFIQYFMHMRFEVFYFKQIPKLAVIPPWITICDRERFIKDNIYLILHIH
jgi:hypothetical protein